MTPEHHQLKPYEIFGITEQEVVRWRVSDEKFKEIIVNPSTTTHTIELSTNAFGEFLFVAASRRRGQQRVCMTFYGFGFHEYRERWICNEWFWYQTPADLVEIQKVLSGEEVVEKLDKRLADISHNFGEDTQTELGRMYEHFADLTDDDAALAEMQDLGLL